QTRVTVRGGTDLFARATRALAGATADADDATLVALLGPILVPALGDVAALYTIGPDGHGRLARAAPPHGLLAPPPRIRLARSPDAAAAYAALAAGRRAATVQATGPSEPAEGSNRRPDPEPPSRVLGLAAEIAAPLGGGNGHDALL